jgi:hypothetical protein
VESDSIEETDQSSSYGYDWYVRIVTDSKTGTINDAIGKSDRNESMEISVTMVWWVCSEFAMEGAGDGSWCCAIARADSISAIVSAQSLSVENIEDESVDELVPVWLCNAAWFISYWNIFDIKEMKATGGDVGDNDICSSEAIGDAVELELFELIVRDELCERLLWHL